VHSATRQWQRHRRTRFAWTPRVSQPAEPAQAGGNQWIHPSSVPARRRSGRRKVPNPAGRARATGDASLSPSSGFARTVSIRTNCPRCQRTRHLEPVLRHARRPNSQSGRRAPLGVASRFAGAHQRCIRLRLFCSVVTRLPVGVSLLWAARKRRASHRPTSNHPLTKGHDKQV
jgi:hypothetical protein